MSPTSRRAMALACARGKDGAPTEDSNGAREYLTKVYASLENLTLSPKTVVNLKKWLERDHNDNGFNLVSLKWIVTFLSCAVKQRTINSKGIMGYDYNLITSTFFLLIMTLSSDIESYLLTLKYYSRATGCRRSYIHWDVCGTSIP